MPYPSIIDCHFHLYAEDDTVAILERGRAAGICAFIATATNLADAGRLCQLAETEHDVYATVGIHPHEAEDFDGNIEPFRVLADNPHVVAIGEIGLDYYYNHSPRESQLEVFKQFLNLAAATNLPAVIHCRDAYDDCLDVLQNHRRADQPFMIHSYTGTPEWAQKIIELGGYFSFNGMCTFKKADNIREALRAIPLERIMLETDAPYLSPVPYRGKRNEPAYLIHVLEKVAEEFGIDTEEAARQTTLNTQQFFELTKTN